MAVLSPVVALATAAPAYAASTANIDIGFSNNFCRGGGRDAYTHTNLTNNSGSDIILESDVVLRVQISNPNRSRTAPSSDVGVQSCRDTSSSLTGCSDVLWTLPRGTRFVAGATIDMAWHFLADWGDPAHIIVSQVSGPSIFSNPSTSSTTQGYIGPSGCFSHDEF